MSNCIEICTDMVTSLDTLDYDKLLQDIETASTQLGPPPDLKGYIMWWFLSDGAVYVEGDDLVISLGHARSQLTYRDLRQVGFVLSEYTTVGDGNHLVLPVLLKDEGDDWQSTTQYHLNCLPHLDH